jgi:chromosome segregation ATPase
MIEVKQLAAQLSQAETRRDDCLAGLAERLKDSLENEANFNEAVQAVNATHVVHGQLAGQLQKAEATLSAEMQSLDEALLNEQKRLTEIQERQQRAQLQCDDAQVNLKREQARLQRLGIEQRNIEHEDKKDPQALARLQELQRQAGALIPQIDRAHNAEHASRATLKEANAEVDPVQFQLQELQRKKDLLGRSLSVRVREASLATHDAVQQRRAALADLGRAVLWANGRVAIDDVTLDELMRHDDSVAALWLRHQVYLLAVDNYDRNATRRGLVIAVALGALLALAILWRYLT